MRSLRRRFSGNPAGVVLDADALSADDMHALARELNNGDTAFLLRPDAEDHDLRVRFFTPRREAAFVGHATLAAHAVLAALKLAPRRRQKQASGIVDVDSIDGAWPPRIADPSAAAQVAARPIRARAGGGARGAGADALRARCSAARRCSPVSAGRGCCSASNAARHWRACGRTWRAWRRCPSSSARPGYFLFSSPALAWPAFTTEARMFCPALGIPGGPGER